MKNKHILRIIIVLIVLLVPLSKLNTEIDVISPIDNKYLQKFPDIGEGYSEFLTQLDTYLTERLGGRARLIKYNLVLNDRLFNLMEHPSYQYGKDDYVFFKVSRGIEDYDFLDAFTDYLVKVQNYCQEREVPFVYLLNPSKTTVYQQYLPEGFHDENKRLEVLQHYLEDKHINFVDNTPYFIELSKTEQIFNKKYDAGHWNALGAYFGVNNLIEKMQEFAPDIQLNKFEDFNISTETKYSLPVSDFPIDEDIPVITEKTTSFAEIDVGLNSEIAISEQHRGYYRFESSADNDINLLIFHGSYFNGYGFPFLARAVKTYQNIHNYENLLNFEYYFNIFQPNFVVVTTAEYATKNHYFDTEKLKTKTFNETIDLTSFVDSGMTIEFESIETGQYLSKLTFSHPNVKQGYFVSDNKAYDLLQEDDKWSITTFVEKMNLEESRLYLKMSNGEKLIFSLK